MDRGRTGRKSGALRWDKAHTAELFRRLKTESDAAARDELIRMYINLVEYLARQFRNRGENLDDLTQVGTIGLIKAIDRFDPARAVEFTTYATPTIVGEIKRHFRDKGWAIRIPRRLQELNLKLNEQVYLLTQDLERSPTVPELAEALSITPEEVLEAMETGQAYSLISLDGLSADEGDEPPLSLLDYIGREDKGYSEADSRCSLHKAYERLDDRERKILTLRFYKGLTQTEIAGIMGISQMHVSRLLRRALATLRAHIGTEDR